MILVDTCVWIDHLRRAESGLQCLLRGKRVLSHPFVVGELAMGLYKQRDLLLDELLDLPKARVAEDDEVLQFVSRRELFGLGLGYIDVHLLVAAKLTPGTLLWTRDLRLKAAAETLGLAAAES